MTRRILAPLLCLVVACVSEEAPDDGAGGTPPTGMAGSAGTNAAPGGTGGAGASGSAAVTGGAGGSAASGGTLATGGNPLGGAAGAGDTGGMSLGGMSTGGLSMGGVSTGGTAVGGTATGGMAMGGTAMGGSGGANCVEAGRMVGMTAAHNAARAKEGANLKPLSWDCKVAAYAQTYANKLRDEQGCWNLVHSGGPYGENLYASGSKPNPPNKPPQAAVDSWYSEKANYNYAANSCSGVCGHYTQVVWGDSERLGCGVATCPANAEGWLYEVWVCNYDPPGNFNGTRPY